MFSLLKFFRKCLRLGVIFIKFQFWYTWQQSVKTVPLWKSISQIKCYNINGYSGIIIFQNFSTANKMLSAIFPVYFGSMHSHTTVYAEHKCSPWLSTWLNTSWYSFLWTSPHILFLLFKIIWMMSSILSLKFGLHNKHFTKCRDFSSEPLICTWHQTYTI